MELLNRLSRYLAVMGIPGLLAISFLDSAAVPLAGGPDAVLMLLSWRRPELLLWIALAATVGSTLGCFVLYGIGRKGGEKALARFDPGKVSRMERRMRDYGVWLVAASVMAPPPFPTKLVVLASGVLGTGKGRFGLAVFAGRFVRYLLVACLAARYGDQAAGVLSRHYPAVSAVLAVILAVLFLLRRRRRARGPKPV
ncbi:MAG: DedA family protein [Acidobacteria bacterium]|nr:DedA family protein [Acidobacteriota bacterium]